MADTLKLYAVVHSSLSEAQKLVQALHGILEFEEQHRDVFTQWKRESNTLVVLECDTIGHLTDACEKRGIVSAKFFEPDLDNLLTVAVFESKAKPVLRRLPLALNVPVAKR